MVRLLILDGILWAGKGKKGKKMLVESLFHAEHPGGKFTYGYSFVITPRKNWS